MNKKIQFFIRIEKLNIREIERVFPFCCITCVEPEMSLVAFGTVEWVTNKSGVRCVSIVPVKDAFGNVTVMDRDGWIFKVPYRLAVPPLAQAAESLLPMPPPPPMIPSSLRDPPVHKVYSEKIVSRYIEFKGARVQIIDGELKNQEGIFLGVEGDLCVIDVNSVTYKIKPTQFRYLSGDTAEQASKKIIG